MKNNLKEAFGTPKSIQDLKESPAKTNIPEGYRRLTIVISNKHHDKLKEVSKKKGSKFYLIMHDAIKKYLEYFGG